MDTQRGARPGGRGKWAGLVLCLWTLGCGEGVIAPNEATDKTGPLFGNLTTPNCSAAQATILREGHDLGQLLSPSQEYGACVAWRMVRDYKQCNSAAEKDPFLNQSVFQQLERLLNITREANQSPVEVTCANIATDGFALYGTYGDAFEQVQFSHNFLNGLIANGPNDEDMAKIAGLMWHEALHQQGYKHGNGTTELCGYPAGSYDQYWNSANYLAQDCIRAAGLKGRAFVKAANGTRASFGLGRHLASRGDLAPIGDDQIRKLTLGPATHATYCFSEAPTPPFPFVCGLLFNPNPNFGIEESVPAGISYLEVSPSVLVYREPNFIGVQQVLGFGEFRNDLGHLSIGNDAIQSIYVPAGMRVRACEHEGVPAGHGSGRCVFYDAPAANLGAMAKTISYLEIERVVTAFREVNGHGVRQNFGHGVFVAPDSLGAVGDNQIISLIVPHGITAQVCSDAGPGGTGAGTCRTFEKTNFNLFPTSSTSNISFLRAGPAPRDTGPLPTGNTFTLNVNRSGAGAVVSAPFGIQCGTACAANFYRRGKVELIARKPDVQYVADWVGCDYVTNETCVVAMSQSRTVSVNIHLPIPKPSCYPDCYSLCREDGGRPGDCMRFCRAQCRS